MDSEKVAIRARCEKKLKARVLRVVQRRADDRPPPNESDIVRMAAEDYCDAQEMALGLKPITAREVEELLKSPEPPQPPTTEPQNGNNRATGRPRKPKKPPGGKSW